MKKVLIATAILFIQGFYPVFIYAQNYTEVVYLKNGSIIRGTIIEQVPNESIKIQTGDKSVFVYQMDEVEKITKELSDTKKTSEKAKKSYSEYYFFGGFSSKKLVETGTLQINNYISYDYYNYEIYYKNGGLGGIGIDWLMIGKDRRPDVMIDLEASLYGAKMTTELPDYPLSVEMTGLALCTDMHFTIFPIKARNKYPCPFVFVGAGLRVLALSAEGVTAKEYHGELPFGLGVRQKVSEVVSFQIKERFVYSTLKDVGGFILPETRIELVLSFGK